MAQAKQRASATETLARDDVNVGDTLPPLEIPVTTSLIVSGALATRDFEQVHHDKAVAQSTGMPDVFMNILTSEGLMETYVTEWSGPETRLKKLSVRLGAPNIPGTTMTVSGEVKDKRDGEVDVEVIGQNDNWGMHMKGLVTIELPR